ncbi:hypothetical protein J4711_14790 [Staphylococcus epidermidis]|nr:hypothetical protein [Staphylococcus epidermidis]
MSPVASTAVALPRTKNKTLATWLTLIGGSRTPPLLHHGFGDWIGWLLPVPTALGFYGMERVQQLGQDDRVSWILILCSAFASLVVH